MLFIPGVGSAGNKKEREKEQKKKNKKTKKTNTRISVGNKRESKNIRHLCGFYLSLPSCGRGRFATLSWRECQTLSPFNVKGGFVLKNCCYCCCFAQECKCVYVCMYVCVCVCVCVLKLLCTKLFLFRFFPFLLLFFLSQIQESGFDDFLASFLLLILLNLPIDREKLTTANCRWSTI